MKATEAMVVFDEAAEILTKQARDSENRHYPYRVAALFNDFELRFGRELSSGESSRIVKAATRILDEQKRLPPRIQEHYSVRDCRHRLGELIARDEEKSSRTSQS